MRKRRIVWIIVAVIVCSLLAPDFVAAQDAVQNTETKDITAGTEEIEQQLSSDEDQNKTDDNNKEESGADKEEAVPAPASGTMKMARSPKSVNPLDDPANMNQDFRKAIFECIKVEMNWTDISEMTVEDLENYGGSLNLSGEKLTEMGLPKLTDITGITYLKNAKEIDLRDNQITSLLPLSVDSEDSIYEKWFLNEPTIDLDGNQINQVSSYLVGIAKYTLGTQSYSGQQKRYVYIKQSLEESANLKLKLPVIQLVDASTSAMSNMQYERVRINSDIRNKLAPFGEIEAQLPEGSYEITIEGMQQSGTLEATVSTGREILAATGPYTDDAQSLAYLMNHTIVVKYPIQITPVVKEGGTPYLMGTDTEVAVNVDGDGTVNDKKNPVTVPDDKMVTDRSGATLGYQMGYWDQENKDMKLVTNPEPGYKVKEIVIYYQDGEQQKTFTTEKEANAWLKQMVADGYTAKDGDENSPIRGGSVSIYVDYIPEVTSRTDDNGWTQVIAEGNENVSGEGNISLGYPDNLGDSMSVSYVPKDGNNYYTAKGYYAEDDSQNHFDDDKIQIATRDVNGDPIWQDAYVASEDGYVKDANGTDLVITTTCHILKKENGDYTDTRTEETQTVKIWASHNKDGVVELTFVRIAPDGRKDDAHGVYQPLDVKIANAPYVELDIQKTIQKECRYWIEDEENFVFRIEYRDQEDGVVAQTFYEVVTVNCEDDGVNEVSSALSKKIKGRSGYYTVTEADSNWRYKNTGTAGLTQQLVNGTVSGTASFTNFLDEECWVSDNVSVENTMKSTGASGE